MTAAIDFYFDFSSPYGYFASTRIDDLAQKYGRNVAWHPILLGVVFKTTGASPLPQLPLKGDYSWRDFERTARFHGIDYKRPTHFPLPTTHAARAMLWLQNHHGDDLAAAFARSVYRALFVDDINIAEPAEIMKLAEPLGVDVQALDAGATSYQIKDQLKAEIEVAMAKGVFGSPFVIVDGEPFWGFDRFDQIEAHLKSRRQTELRAVPNPDTKEKKPA
ncbi:MULTISPECIES: 2-hydroxychromene-2-carboxylate isomerase [Cupriavidus]|uniref:2-hydroxychromene-2-carboxylate isomerase n=1 Tax=Cupriavidus taiwanensis TaxID=164546 RepID=A0A375CTV4_9BURK|nr:MULTISPECIES: 2-hydroxychromene-2-carboxylate isomerase [Cupriavidus]MEC3767145.1 2-hydroxychromene-2-carboxylate isomerase [Cupriavidus sp. SS-3]SOY78831.1 putative thioredoxin oxidoreductase [Cupriavidus taiwanensis]SOY80618.1 putative thioredoxin oxidoreductase [Cupriavidus taiwanensis]SPA47667.1 putative thioredoxin oxidoreductase [Cupriavidus taiwanensis]SPD63133.1 2-hydroxychromene-2-carboxylate isomerase [Cupriavidus taiwanensis]